MPRTTDPDSLSLKPSTATVRGERARPDFSGVRGTADTVPATDGDPQASDPSSASTTPSSNGVQRYTVKSGDTLSHIAKAHYGKAGKWRAIFEANRDQIDDPDRIFPGQVLKIPAIDTDGDGDLD